MDAVFVNPKACGGKGIRRWEKISPLLKQPYKKFILNGNDAAEACKEYYNCGIRNFIAAGGDGTVNYLLNLVMNVFSIEQLYNIKFGAIGLGSSNDFHKPFNRGTYLDRTPAMINFESAEYRDVGCITYINGDHREKKYFLINASIGITAEANNLFNKPDNILFCLKRINTSIAIVYAALKTILGYRNFTVLLGSQESGAIVTELTNLGVVKNPCFSGSLRYGSHHDYSNGYFDVFLNNEMTTKETIRLLQLLSKGNFDLVDKKMSWKTPAIYIRSDHNFYVEYDGEIITTNNVHLSVLSKHMKVCTC